MARKKLIEKTGEMAIEEKILTLLSLNTVIKALIEKKEEVKETLRSYIEANPKGKTSEGYLFWEGKTAGALLQDSPLHETDINGLIAEVGLNKAVEFLTINRTALIKAVEAKSIPLTLGKLEKITLTDYGKKKVIPYYGLRDIKKGGVRLYDE